MNEEADPSGIRARLTRQLLTGMESAAGLHRQYLQTRLTSLTTLSQLLLNGHKPAEAREIPAIFNEGDLNEFALGSITACFGEEFRVLENLRHPRIPNTSLMLMTRIISIEGNRGAFQAPARIVSEWDVPAQPWFSLPTPSAGLPISIWMEAALQPCGFLSAWMGTMLLHPEQDYYFRNLDGQATILSDLDVRGKTITCAATLESTSSNNATIIQRYSFRLSCAGVELLSGNTVFGFFPPQMMANQSGLDGGRTLPPAFPRPQGQALTSPSTGSHRLNLLDDVVQETGEDGTGSVVHGRFVNFPAAWFYRCHFHEDPVMPGSLGVEAVYQALRLLAPRLLPQATIQRQEPARNSELVWKYRGQVLPTHKQMTVSLGNIHLTGDQCGYILSADASVWADNLRIYEVRNAALSLVTA